jgi:hypothetical protein
VLFIGYMFSLIIKYFTKVFFYQGESVFLCTNFNIVGFLLFIFTALHVSVLGPSSGTHIFHRIYSIDNGSVVFF